MPYATTQDLVDAYGEAEMVRLTTEAGTDLGAVVAARAEAKLAEVSGLMDSYLRKQVPVPVVPGTPVLRSCCLALARYALMFTGGVEPTEQARLARKEWIEWLQRVADGSIVLDGAGSGPGGPAAQAIGARTRDRAPAYAAGGRLPW